MLIHCEGEQVSGGHQLHSETRGSHNTSLSSVSPAHPSCLQTYVTTLMFLPITMSQQDLFFEDFDDTSIFENKAGLAEDMRFLASIPELCDITFLVGETREVSAALVSSCQFENNKNICEACLCCKSCSGGEKQVRSFLEIN